MNAARLLGAVGALTCLAAGLAACTKVGPAAGPTSGDVAVTATDSSCALARTELAAGVTKFVVSNNGSKITEFEVMQGDKIQAEVENLSPQTQRSITVELAAGSYDGVCRPGMAGKGFRTTFSVSGDAAALTQDEKLAHAVTDYAAFVQQQVAALVPATRQFTDAIRAGNIERAMNLYPVARTPYETIEPVAESFGDLDPRIDAREGDVDPGTPWTGFHILEKHLWVDHDIKHDKALADQLDADVNQLATLVKSVDLQPLEIANGAKELLDEVATSKITGEEDRYSHTDLWDFNANVIGAKAAVDALRPALADRDPALLSDVDAAYAKVEQALAPYRVDVGWKLYTALTPADTKALADAVSGLAEPISKLAAAITKPRLKPGPAAS
jgi:iron uptake system component EfeO